MLINYAINTRKIYMNEKNYTAKFSYFSVDIDVQDLSRLEKISRLICHLVKSKLIEKNKITQHRRPYIERFNVSLRTLILICIKIKTMLHFTQRYIFYST